METHVRNVCIGTLVIVGVAVPYLTAVDTC